MPRIRKRTSNRQNTRDRAKITKKAAETKRKTRKAGKKDVTWKSNKKKDPGIPNSFPFKDQIIAELAEERRKAEEEKIARREAAKAAKSAPPEEEPEGDTPGIISLAGTSILSRKPLTGFAEPLELAAAVEDVPDLIDTAIPTLQDALDRADVVVEVVDARDIMGGRSGHVEGLVREAEGKIVLLINKIDLVPREALQAWLSKIDIPAFLYKSAFSTQPAASSSKTPAPVPSIDPSSVLGRAELFQAIKAWAAEKNPAPKGKGSSKKASAEPASPLVLTFMGLPSVGKTSVLNSLLAPAQRKHTVASTVPLANSAKQPEPTTKAPVEVEIEVDGEKIRLIDTPGWEHAEDDEEEEEDEDEEEEEDDEEVDPAKWDQLEARLAGDLLRRNLGRVDKVKDVFPLVNYIVKRSNHQDLMLAYNIPFIQAGDVEAFLTSLARAQGRIRKHGEPDLEAAARILLRDWAHNVFPYYTTPSSSSSTSMDVEKTGEYDMSSVLEKCKGKKELKKENAKGLVRFKSGDLDTRDVILDDDYTALAGPSDDEDEDEEDDEDEDELDDEDEDDDEDGLVIGSDDGEELDLEDGPEPSSGSDVEEEDDDEEEDEEEEESEPEPEPEPVSAKKRKRVSLAASVKETKTKKAKRVSFAKGETAPSKPTKGILKRKRG
ncbi:hypothetical protein IAU59_004433 [Kwoniella sp. CBS 9459]